jgi:SulP family sulfate permease
MSSKTAISRFLPITAWLTECSPRSDIVAGVVLAGLLVPQGMAYAGIAGVPPQMGLYAAAAGMFVYAMFGTSRQLAVTTTSSSAAMLAALVSPLAPGDVSHYSMLASAATVAAGLIFLASGLLKLGSVSEFISKPVLKGFVFGLALIIMVKQAHKFMGIPGGHGSFFHQAWNVITSLRAVNPWTLSVGTIALVIMYLLATVAPRVPAALVVLVLGTLAVPWFGLQQHGVEVVGTMHASLPSLSWPKIGEDEIGDIFVGAIGIVLVLMAEALVAGRTFAAKHKYEIDPNQELSAIGLANVTSGLVGGIIVGGGMSGTAANDAGGARSQLSAITASLCVVLTLAFLLPAIRNLPEAVLAAIVINAVVHLADVATLRYYVKLGTGSFWVSLIALVAVLQMGILKGLIFAVGLTLIVLMRKLSKPQDSVLGRLAGSGDFVDIARYPEAKQVPGLLIFRPNGVLFFANAGRIRNRLRELVENSDAPLHTVVLNLETSPEIDLTSLEMLQQMAGELQEMGIGVCFARVADPVRDLFARSGFLEHLGQQRIFRGVGAAVDAFLEKDQPAGQARSA